ncbi:MAG TPA: HAD family phosphatase [Bryobacteraceae bacterium]|nr:HAD family phosphatase [Bryobacteraceae bacterium]
MGNIFSESGDLALLFDMDGVVVDSTAIHTEAWNQYLQMYGKRIPSLQHRMLGKHNDEIVREFFDEVEMNQAEVAQHGARKEQLYRSLIGPSLPAYMVPGILAFLQAHQNLPMGLATNAEAANVNFILDSADLRRYFRCVVSGYDVQRPKPYPDVYLRAASLLGVPPESCIVFEDSVVGVQAAKAAGMRVVGVATTIRQLAGVDVMISDFREPQLSSWLGHLTYS